MKPLTMDDLLPIETYIERREEIRKSTLEMKRPRRIGVGPFMTIIFENRETMFFQIHEILKVEEITEKEGIEGELQAYNSLLPGDNELSATLFIEIDSAKRRKEILPTLVGIEESARLEGAGRKIVARAEEGRTMEDYTASVHYLWFPFDEGSKQAFLDSDDWTLWIDHENYSHGTKLSKETIDSLRGDLKE